jgi:pimeloyl-ACP methyl ester carboxylesterase
MDCGWARIVVAACCLAAAVPAGAVEFGSLASLSLKLPAAPVGEPLSAARRHLREADRALESASGLAKRQHPHAVDAFFIACEEAWNAVWTCPESAEIVVEAGDLYARALGGLLESARAHGRLRPEGLVIGPRSRRQLVPFDASSLPLGPGGIGSLEPQSQADDDRIVRRHVRCGFGLPVVVRVKPVPGDPFAPPRQSLAATAVLRFDVPGNENAFERFAGPASRDHAAAVLDLANPVEIAAVKIGSARPHLAADLTAPLLDMLAGMPRSGIEGFVQPFGRGDTRPRLEFLEPHRPGRIPVVFIHGLASDEGTWFDMVNELRAWPEFHRRFEPWVFHYPTGAAFVQSSARLRSELRRAVRLLDPEGRDPALGRIVLVGHSMGGLHAKMQVVASGTALWDAVALVPFAEVRLPPAMRAVARPAYFFEPLPNVTRIVCIATPHRGSVLASLGVGRLASVAVRPPPDAQAIHDTAVRLNPGAFRDDFARKMPTTIDLLEPDSELLRALEGLRPACWVAVHSIVGDGHRSLTGGRDDCVVSVESAHTTGAASEIAVPATHTKVHHHPQSVAELRRILTLHVAETAR